MSCQPARLDGKSCALFSRAHLRHKELVAAVEGLGGKDRGLLVMEFAVLHVKLRGGP